MPVVKTLLVEGRYTTRWHVDTGGGEYVPTFKWKHAGKTVATLFYNEGRGMWEIEGPFRADVGRFAISDAGAKKAVEHATSMIVEMAVGDSLLRRS